MLSQSTHLQMCLSSSTLKNIIRTGLPILVELIDPVNSVLQFFISNDLTQMVNFTTRIPNCDSHSPTLLYFFCLTLVFVLQWFSLHWEILIMLLSQFPLTFHNIHNGMPCFIVLLMTILVLIEKVFMTIWEMFYERISLKSVLLLLLVNFVSEFRLELMYISLIESIRSSLTHLHGFQLVLLP